MRRRTLAALLVTVVAAGALPGCIAVFGGDDSDDEGETPNRRALTDLERRMDRLEQALPKQPK